MIEPLHSLYIHSPFLVLFIAYVIIGMVSLNYSKKYKLLKDPNFTLPLISVVIPTYNEASIIKERLTNLLKTAYPHDKMEIIITDSSNDDTPYIIDQFIKEHPNITIKLIHDDERRGLAVALNKAYDECNGEIIVKMDSDLELDKHSLLNIVSNFSDPKIGAVTGRIQLLDKNNKEKNYRTIQNIIQQAESYIDSIYMAHTFVAYRRNLIRRYKPTHYGDETIQTIHIRRQGYRVIYDTSAVFYEYVPEDKEMLRQKIRRAEGHVGILFENIDMLFNQKYSKFGLYVFPSNFFMLIISPLLAALSIIMASLDLTLFRSSIPLDVAILSFVPITFMFRKKYIANGIWTFIELQYSQLIAIFNVMKGRRDNKWTKIRRIEELHNVEGSTYA